jgi:glycosyltransferase involved in cell wall biosynthesis
VVNWERDGAVRIGINALAVSPDRPGGDVTYVLEMVRHLPVSGPDDQFVIFVAPWARGLLGALPANTRCVVCRVPRGSIVARALWEQSVLVPLATWQRLDVLFAPVNVAPIGYPGKIALTLHEAEPFMPASQIPLPLVVWWRVMRTLSARRAARILTVSQAARADLARWMGLPASRVQVVPLGVDLTRFSAAARVGPPPLHGAPYVLWVGRSYPHKNVDILLDAFARLRTMGRAECLVLIGPPGWNEAVLAQRIRSEFDPGAVVRLPAVWNELPSWYAHASVFVFPSTHESFGLPILEAMACGTPVVAADIPALREVGDDAALNVLPRDAQALAVAIRELLTDTHLREKKRQLGLLRASRFDWRTTAETTLSHVRSVART